MGYHVETRKIIASDLGAGTTRERLYMIARCDGRPIVWPEPTHAKTPHKGQKPWKPAAECIDWSIPCPSIFTRKRPLAPATMKRIAKGMKRYVLDSADPFIVPIAHYNGSEPVHSVREPLRTVTAFPKGGTFAVAAPTIVPSTHQGDNRVHDPKDPLPTITAAHRGELMAVMPYMVQAGHGEGTQEKPRHSHGIKDIIEPLGTVVASGGGHAIAAATLVQAGYGEREGQSARCLDIEKPLGTVVAGSVKHALASAHLVKFRGESVGHGMDEPVPTITSGAGAKRPAGAAHALGVSAAYLMQANGGFNTTPGHDVREPMSTITNSGSQQQVVTAFLSSYYTDDSNRCRSPEDPVATVTTANRVGVVAAHLAHLRGNCDARDLDTPLHTISAGGQHHAVVEYSLSPEDEAGALRVAAFLLEYYSEGGQWSDLHDPLNTITTRDRLALVTVTIQGTPYVIVDIGLRMLTPRELYRAQGFREDYIIDFGHDGRKFTKDQQVRMVGNSVPPDVIAAIYRANLGGTGFTERRVSTKSGIEWTRTLHADGTFTPGSTWSPITGCTKKSEGCRNCWAKQEVEARWSKNPRSVFFGRAFSDIRCHPEQLQQVIRQRKGRRIFVYPRADLFHEEVPFEFMAAVFGAMAIASKHTFLVLTKRTERMLEFFEWVSAQAAKEEVSETAYCVGMLDNALSATLPDDTGYSEDCAFPVWPLPNVQLGASVEDQPTADERIPMLLKAPAAVRWLSLEPLLGAINLELLDCMGGPYRKIDWIVLGGESGDNARPMHPEWVRDIQEQCHYAHVPFFFKQWGEWLPISEMEDSGDHLYEPIPEGYPPDATRRCRVARRAIGYDAGEHWQVVAGNPSYLTFKVGKRAAGHRLGGEIYHQFPRSIQ